MLVLRTEPISDFARVFEMAGGFVRGEPVATLFAEYIQRNPFQIGPALLESIPLFIFGTNIVVVYVYFAMFIATSNLLIYLITKKITGSYRIAFGTGLLYLFYIGSYTLTPMITNQHMSTCLMLAGIYLFLCADNKWYRYLLAGLLLGIGNIAKPTGILVLVALGLILLSKLFEVVFRRVDRRALLSDTANLAKGIGIVFISYLLIGFTISTAVTMSGLTERGIRNDVMLTKLAFGTDLTHGGGPSREMSDYLLLHPDGAVRRARAIEVLQSRLDYSWQDWKGLIHTKLDKMWTGYDSWMYALWGKDDSSAYRLLTNKLLLPDLAYMFAFWVLILSGLISFFDKSEVPLGALLLTVIFMGAFVLFLGIEAQTRYRHEFIPLILPIAGFGVRWLHEKTETAQANWKMKSRSEHRSRQN